MNGNQTYLMMTKINWFLVPKSDLLYLQLALFHENVTKLYFYKQSSGHGKALDVLLTNEGDDVECDVCSLTTHASSYPSSDHKTAPHCFKKGINVTFLPVLY